MKKSYSFFSLFTYNVSHSTHSSHPLHIIILILLNLLILFILWSSFSSISSFSSYSFFSSSAHPYAFNPPYHTYLSFSSVSLDPVLIIVIVFILYPSFSGCTRVSTGISGYGLRTEMIRKFFPFPLWKRFRKTGIPERFFPVKRKFPERCSGITYRSGITDRYGIPERSGNFRNVPEYRSGNFPKNRSGNFRFSKQLVP